MWHCVDLVWTDISKERIASIFREVVRSSEDLHSATSQKTAFFRVTVSHMYVSRCDASALLVHWVTGGRDGGNMYKIKKQMFWKVSIFMAGHWQDSYYTESPHSQKVSVRESFFYRTVLVI
jgi:hypothetical protein